MSEPQSSKQPAKLPYLSPEQFPGMEVFEIDLSRSGKSLSPFKASRFTVDPDFTSPVDSHAVQEMWMVAQGEGELYYDDQAIRIHASDVIYLEPPKPHQVKNVGAETLVIYSVWW